MARILIALALSFVTGTSVAIEKVWYCDVLKAGGLKIEGGLWKTTNFKTTRFIIKQSGDQLFFSDDYLFLSGERICKWNKMAVSPTIECRNMFSRFWLGTETGKAIVSVVPPIWAMSKFASNDSFELFIAVMECETF